MEGDGWGLYWLERPVGSVATSLECLTLRTVSNEGANMSSQSTNVPRRSCAFERARAPRMTCLSVSDPKNVTDEVVAIWDAEAGCLVVVPDQSVSVAAER